MGQWPQSHIQLPQGPGACPSPNRPGTGRWNWGLARASQGVSPLPPPSLLPPQWNWGIGDFCVCVCAGFTPWLDGSFRLFYLRTEVTLRFMGAINPCPISTLIEAICIVTKIIRDNFIGIFKKIITFHIFKLCKCGGHPAGLPGPSLESLCWRTPACLRHPAPPQK